MSGQLAELRLARWLRLLSRSIGAAQLKCRTFDATPHATAPVHCPFRHPHSKRLPFPNHRFNDTLTIAACFSNLAPGNGALN